MGEGESVRSFVVVHNPFDRLMAGRDLKSFFVFSIIRAIQLSRNAFDIFVVSFVVSFVENFVASPLYHVFLDPQERASLFPGKRRSSRQRTGEISHLNTDNRNLKRIRRSSS